MKKGSFSTLILILIFLVGLSLLLYPTVSDYWNYLHQSRAISEYAEQVADLDNKEYDRILASAKEYNQRLSVKPNPFVMTNAEKKEYNSLLNVSGNNVLGYIEIPAIKCSLPIYHGTDENVLQVAIGHIEWSSLPVGGENTHTVLSGHRGLPSAKLFTDLDDLVKGDFFMIRVLDETVTYEVDRISIVEPQEVDSLVVEKGKDLCTLVTCTPYGINSHRLLVRGHRVENQKTSGAVRITADAMQVEPAIVAPIVAAPMLLVLLIYLLVKTGKKSAKKQDGVPVQVIIEETGEKVEALARQTVSKGKKLLVKKRDDKGGKDSCDDTET